MHPEAVKFYSRSDGFLIVFLTNGVASCGPIYFDRTFAEAKRYAIKSLKETLEARHGRGDLGVQVWEAVWEDKTAPEMRKLGFQEDYQRTLGKLRFEL